ncbi:hypothetical protein BJ980_001980 [Nocardioides daedukensis]|uniref:Uncharacterized protein n=1 Tax=Nocardioides daedukensis TaxID=634462 RepID=A0A7Y9S234_9ACTN|nr:hypothetical protein [Nocardioides daedukensis]NYG59057.1 hypothetical protein [Nocardioides daedukensis]
MLLAVLLGPNANADNFNYGNDSLTCTNQPCPQTNKNFYRYHDANLPAMWEDAVNDTHWNTYTVVPGWNSYNTVVHNDADVHYLIDTTLDYDTAGTYVCSTQSSGGQTCDHGHIRFNGIAPYNSWGAVRKEALACHESAHSVGLKHPTSNVAGAEATYGCVATPHLFSGPPEPDLKSHNRSHMQVSNPY